MNSDSGVSVLGREANYDDQGLFFSLILAAVLLVFFGSVSVFFTSTSVLWIKRLFRPNHTVEPPPRWWNTTANDNEFDVSPSGLQPGSGRDICNGDSPDEVGARLSASTSLLTTQCTRQRQHRADGSTVIRRKRLGISLPYRATLLRWPTWRDWFRIEEQVPHLSGALSPTHYLNPGVAAQFTGERYFVPLTPSLTTAPVFPSSGAGGAAGRYGCSPKKAATPARGGGGGGGGIAALAPFPAFASTTSEGGGEGEGGEGEGGAGSVMTFSPRSPKATSMNEESGPPHGANKALGGGRASTATVAPASASASFSGEPFTSSQGGTAIGNQSGSLREVGPSTPATAAQVMPSYGTSSPPDHRLTTGATALSGNTKDEGGVKKTTKAARKSFTDLAFSQSATANDARSRATDERHGLEDLYPKTPLDPQVALYIYTLKFFATVTFLGSCFSIWISVVASQDGYMERYMVRRDIHQCHKQDGNETNCLALKPYCKYMGVDAGCSPVPLHGLYDMSVQNIAPRSWRWWPVSILNLLFCVVFVVCTVYYVRTVNRYIKTVMRNQMEHAMGYRVACVRGIDADDARSTTAFYRNFLSEQAYFAARPSQATTTTVVATTHQSTHGPHTTVQHHRSHSADAPSSDSESDVSDGDDYYEQIECTGLGCLFSVIGCYYYSTRRRDACFTQPGKVRQILFTREPPHNMYPTIHDTEDAMADLQEALADEKAMRRRHAVRGFKPHKDTHRPTMLQELRRRNSAPVVMNGSTPSHSRRASDDEQRDAAANAATAARFTNPAASVPSASTTQVVVAGARSPSEDGGAFAASEEGNKHVKMLMMHAPFPQCCSRIPAVEYRTKKFREKATKLNSKIALVPRQRTTGAAFVIFSDSLSAYEFSNLFTARYGGPFVSACASIAGPSGHIIQTNLYADKFLLWIRFFLITVLFIVLLFTWSIPVGFLGSLDSISLIPGIGPAFRDYYYQRVPEWLRGVFTAYLPVIALALFNVALPHIVQRMVLAMGATTKSECDGGHLYLQYLFMILTAVIFQAALQGGLAQLGDLIADPDGEAIRNFFVACVTPQGGYWYAKVITAFSLTTWLDLIEPGHLLSAFLFRGRQHIQRNYDALFMPCEFHYPKLYSTDLMILSFGILFHMTIPLIGLFVSFFFFIRYVTQRAKLYDRYRPTLSPAHDCTDFGVSAQVIRSVQWQYCLAETGGVLLMSLRNHTGGVVLCSISMATAFILLVYVHLQTRHWIASLHNARTFFRPRRRHGVPEASTAEAATTTTATAPNGSAEQPAGSPAASAQGGGTAAAATAAQVAVLSSGRRVSTSTAAAYVRAVAAGAPPMPLEELEQICDDDEVGDYEDQRFSFYDRRQNPYIGHLLPRQPDAGVLYQPKHQRIAPVDVDAEVERMTQTVFTVERYWDRGMTWFEADEDEIEATRVSRPESGNNSGARYDVGGSSPVTMWPPHSPPSPSRPSAPMASEYHDTVAQPPAAAASPSPVPESDVDLMSESPRVVSNSTLLPSSATERVVPAANRASSQSLSGGGGAAAAVPPRPLQETVQPEANTALRESTDSAAPARVRSPPHADSTTTTAAAAAHVATPPSSSARSPSSEGPKEVAETAVPVTRDGDSKEME